ncbi:cysteine hydrolase family protein [Carboxylicivirga marina]|uniref:Cysteine hydrolase n=1 Tax=Carboxylicivirga marina TaxID=2800988 RepID=A0ABS1HLL7_9BACT|nr:cysteine hydrolase family protein [Carboxylicivirga marina]MBK3518506.1 cysteine hydrolase [Carboxylicivirga marina]
MMKQILLIVMCLIAFTVPQKAQNSKGLLLIDIQEFYFPGGAVELVGAEQASAKAASILDYFRENDLLVIHVVHKVKSGGEIHHLLKPLDSEKVITKTDVNAFNGTDLKECIDKAGIEELVIIGMQTHMCLEAAVRAAADLGYKVTVVDSACATRDLEYDGVVIPALQVHASTLSTLKSYAEIISFEVFREKFLN